MYAPASTVSARTPVSDALQVRAAEANWCAERGWAYQHSEPYYPSLALGMFRTVCELERVVLLPGRLGFGRDATIKRWCEDQTEALVSHQKKP